MRKSMVSLISILAIVVIFVVAGVMIQRSSVSLNQIGQIEFSNGKAITVEIADDRAEQVQGLSDRESLEQDHGLLFTYSEKDKQTYWMKDMHFPIDIIWIDGQEIVGFEEDLQPEDPPTSLYSSPVPVDKVLEVSAGFVRENGLNIGDILDIDM